MRRPRLYTSNEYRALFPSVTLIDSQPLYRISPFSRRNIIRYGDAPGPDLEIAGMLWDTPLVWLWQTPRLNSVQVYWYVSAALQCVQHVKRSTSLVFASIRTSEREHVLLFRKTCASVCSSRFAGHVPCCMRKSGGRLLAQSAPSPLVYPYVRRCLQAFWSTSNPDC